jgi:hypothetical protein
MDGACADPDVLGLFERVVRRRLEPMDPWWRVEGADGVIREIGPSVSPFDNSLGWRRSMRTTLT